MSKRISKHHRQARLTPRERKRVWALAAFAVVIIALSTRLHLDAPPAVDRHAVQWFYRQLPGINLTGIDASRREDVLQELNRRGCSCGCEMTLAHCRNHDPECQTSARLCREVLAQFGGTGANVSRRPATPTVDQLADGESEPTPSRGDPR